MAVVHWIVSTQCSQWVRAIISNSEQLYMNAMFVQHSHIHLHHHQCIHCQRCHYHQKVQITNAVRASVQTASIQVQVCQCFRPGQWRPQGHVIKNKQRTRWLVSTMSNASPSPFVHKKYSTCCKHQINNVSRNLAPLYIPPDINMNIVACV